MPVPLIVLLAVIAGLVPAAAVEAAMRVTDDCSGLPAPRMRGRLTVAARDSGIDTATIREGAARVWYPEGIAIEWLDGGETAADPWRGIDFWIVASESPVGARIPNAIGAVRIVDGAPQRLIRLSINVARSWVIRELARQLGVRAGTTSWLLRVGDGAERLRTTLAAAAAHEIGHFVLASTSHADSGLMRADFERTADLDRAGDLRLDTVSRARLAARLAARAACR